MIEELKLEYQGKIDKFGKQYDIKNMNKIAESIKASEGVKFAMINKAMVYKKHYSPDGPAEEAAIKAAMSTRLSDVERAQAQRADVYRAALGQAA